MNKTVIVIFTNNKITNAKQLGTIKKYAFNTSNDLKVGDMIKSQDYSTNMQVVKVLTKAHTYYNASTGKLSNTYSSTAQWEIKELIIREESETAVYGQLIK